MRAARHIALVLAVAGTMAGAQDAGEELLPAYYRVTGVSFDDTLNVREKPDASSGIEDKLAPDAIDVEVTGFSRDGSWARVNSDERPGWAAARYLERQEQAPWYDAAMPLNCYGTEPFWSLKLTSEGSTYDSPEGMEPQQDVASRTYLRYPSPRLGVGLADGFAVIRTEECSDGMSDRVNALAIDLFRRVNGEMTGLSGCCNLGP